MPENHWYIVAENAWLGVAATLWDIVARKLTHDLALIVERRGGANRLGFAVQLGALRYLGFCPEELTTAPASVVAYLSEQLEVSPEVLTQYAQRAQTRTAHWQAVMDYLGFRRMSEADLMALGAWLLDRAMEHDRPTPALRAGARVVLFQLAAGHLYQERLVRPGVTVLERLVVTARSEAQVETYRRLEPLLTPTVQHQLDALLEHDTQVGRAPLVWLRQRATSHAPRAILTTLDKLAYLRQLGVAQWDISRLNPNRLKHLAQVAKKSTRQALARALFLSGVTRPCWRSWHKT